MSGARPAPVLHAPNPMRPLAALLALASCGPLAAPQQADPCATPCAPGAASLGAACGLDDAGPLDGVCAADGTCLAPCASRLDCATLPSMGPCAARGCDAVTGACSYQTVDGPGCGGGGTGL